MPDILIRGTSVFNLIGKVIEIGYDAADCLYAFVNNGEDDILEAIELPPHGDLTDADSLANDLLYDVELARRALDDTTLVGKEREYLQSEKDIKQNCAYYVKNAPVIVPASKETQNAN